MVILQKQLLKWYIILHVNPVNDFYIKSIQFTCEKKKKKIFCLDCQLRKLDIDL